MNVRNNILDFRKNRSNFEMKQPITISTAKITIDKCAEIRNCYTFDRITWLCHQSNGKWSSRPGKNCVNKLVICLLRERQLPSRIIYHWTTLVRIWPNKNTRNFYWSLFEVHYESLGSWNEIRDTFNIYLSVVTNLKAHWIFHMRKVPKRRSNQRPNDRMSERRKWKMGKKCNSSDGGEMKRENTKWIKVDYWPFSRMKH